MHRACVINKLRVSQFSSINYAVERGQTGIFDICIILFSY